MKNSRSRLGLPIAAMLAVVGISFQTQDATPSSAHLTGAVGVVDALRVFDNYPLAIEGRASLEKLRDQLEVTLNELEKQIEQLDLQLDSLTRGSQQWEMTNVQAQAARLTLQGQRDVFSRRMANESQAFAVEMYRQIWEAVDEVAVARELDLVLRKQEQPTELRTVLYSNPALDITKHVINTLKAKN